MQLKEEVCYLPDPSFHLDQLADLTSKVSVESLKGALGMMALLLLSLHRKAAEVEPRHLRQRDLRARRSL